MAIRQNQCNKILINSHPVHNHTIIAKTKIQNQQNRKRYEKIRKNSSVWELVTEKIHLHGHGGRHACKQHKEKEDFGEHLD